MIRAEGLCKHYIQAGRRVPVLEDLDLEVGAGEFVAIMGKSGAGKSTLLQILGCLDGPSAGRYALDGMDVAGLSDEALAAMRNRHIGFVFQTSHFVDYLDLLDNVALPCFYAGHYQESAARDRARQALEQVDLGHRLDHKPAALSGGERQRAAVARALVAGPRVILADEPTGNLDGENAQRLATILNDLCTDGMTIVLVTHDPDMAANARRRLQLAGGRLEAA